ncbi:MAG TPA: class I SAM-dependent methyltransferase [archaeon]|nr:class I SAM-dependent methyltransferase [archaeon]
MELIQVACPLCASKEHKEIFSTTDRLVLSDPTIYRVVKCLSCSLRFVNPRPSNEDIPKLYPDEYFEPQIDGSQLLLSQERINRAKAACFDGLSRTGKILDVGCQKGEFLEFLRRREWETHGVDLNSRAPNLFDLPIHYGSLRQADYPENYFDVITFWSVLEHIPDISEQIEESHRILKPGGTLILLTTNYHSIATGLLKFDDIPRHLILFTRKTLNLLLSKHGFTVKKAYGSDTISKASSYGLLQYLVARFIFFDIESFYREHFRTQYEPRRTLRSRFERITRMGLPKTMLVATDRLLCMFLDQLSILLDLYGIVIVRAQK